MYKRQAVSYIYLILNSEVVKTKSRLKKLQEPYKYFVFAFSLLIFIMTFVYIFVAVDDFYPTDNKEIQQTMDGIDYIRKEKPADYKAITWLRQNIDGQPIILEEVGDAYTYSARVSSTTGLPTVMGWPTHEWQWRGTSEDAFARKAEVENFYNGNTTADVDKEFISKYKVELIFVGNKERETYSQLDEERMKSFGDVIYDEDETFIVRVKDADSES